MTAPNLEERFAAAAFAILTDHNDHTRKARRWAVRFLRRAASGRPTAFQSAIARPNARVARNSRSDARGESKPSDWQEGPSKRMEPKPWAGRAS